MDNPKNLIVDQTYPVLASGKLVLQKSLSNIHERTRNQAPTPSHHETSANLKTSAFLNLDLLHGPRKLRKLDRAESYIDIFPVQKAKKKKSETKT